MSLVEDAERRATSRAWVLYLLAVSVVVATILSVGEPRDDVDGLVMWVILVVLAALQLTPLVGRLGSQALARLLEDETTRDHRRTALAAGFWAATASAVGSVITATFSELTGPDVGRVVLGAALAASLGAFATLELRAAR